LKRFITGEKARDPYKLYPEEYFKQYWLSRHATNCLFIIARTRGLTKKAMLEEFVEDGVKKYMRELVKKDLDALATPEGRAAQAERTSFNLELRRICRELGWDIKKLL
jgi:hypothetical protein